MLSFDGAAVGASRIVELSTPTGVKFNISSSFRVLRNFDKFVVLASPEAEINYLPGSMVLDYWIKNLDGIVLERLEDYVASLIQFLGEADLRLFESGESSWQGSAYAWKMEEESASLVDRFFNDSRFQHHFTPHGEEVNRARVENLEAAFCSFLDEEIAHAYSNNLGYTSYPLKDAVDFMVSSAQNSGFAESWPDRLASFIYPHLDYIEKQGDLHPSTPVNPNLNLSEATRDNLTLLSALLIATRTKESLPTCEFTFIGYGSKDPRPKAISICVDGVFIKPMWWSKPLDSSGASNEWLGSTWQAPEDLSGFPEPVPGDAEFPFWVTQPRANRPLVQLKLDVDANDAWESGYATFAETMIKKAVADHVTRNWGNFFPETSQSELAPLAQEMLVNFQVEKITNLQEIREQRCNDAALFQGSLSPSDMANIVGSKLTLDSYSGIFDFGENGQAWIGACHEVAVISPHLPLVVKTNGV